MTFNFGRNQDRYVDFPPSRFSALSIFAGEWSSEVPGFSGGGPVRLFEDYRVRWFEEQLGGYSGKRVLELGPLEAGHTYMMAQAGAHVTAIESNVRAFMKCLMVKQALDFPADFQLGDFQPYLASTTDRFDFLAMSGVLYHMTDPVALLRNAVRVSDSIGIWTHYYDPAINQTRAHLAHKFAKTPKIVDVGGKRIELYHQRYKKALRWAGFCGGPSEYSYWLTRQSLFDLLEVSGFKITVGDEAPDHQNGPAITLYAVRR